MRLNLLYKAYSTIPTILLSLLLILTMTAYGDSLDEKVERLKTSASVDWHQVSAPIDHFLLIRSGNETCAIKFTEFHRGHDANQGTFLRSDDESFRAEYDWYCQTDGSGDFRRPNATHGHRKVEEKPLFGFGRFAFQTGNTKVKCGSFKLHWLYPTSVSFSKSAGCKDAYLELAPTKWKTIEELAVSDPKIRWFRCDERRKSFYISIDEL